MELDEIVDDVLIEVPGAPLVTIRDQVVKAARDFCTDSAAWNYDQTPIVVAANTDHPQLSVPEGAEVLMIRRLKDGDRELRQGIDYDQPRRDRVEFMRKPESGFLAGEVTLRPRMGAKRLPDALEDWRDAIADGARYRLLRQPRVEWSNPELAQHYLQRFEIAVFEAGQHANFGHARGSRRVKPRRFI